MECAKCCIRKFSIGWVIFEPEAANKIVECSVVTEWSLIMVATIVVSKSYEDRDVGHILGKHLLKLRMSLVKRLPMSLIERASRILGSSVSNEITSNEDKVHRLFFCLLKE